MLNANSETWLQKFMKLLISSVQNFFTLRRKI